jgi:NAD(P)-dependent dehydrogenase (short-subunit alcohol dehydrogenase family)
MGAHPRVHSVVFATGVMPALANMADFSAGEFRTVIDTDVFGFFNVGQAGVKVLATGGGGSLTALITSSMFMAIPHCGCSAVPKAAVDAMVRQFAREEGVNGVRVNAVAPGVIEAGMVLPLLASGGREVLDVTAAETTLGGLGRDVDVAEAVAYFASNRSAYTTGQHLKVDGGHGF